MAEIIGLDDLPRRVTDRVDPGELDLWLAGINAAAVRIAPCLAGDADPPPSPAMLAEAKLILLRAINRWADAGSGAFQQQTAGPFTVTTDTRGATGMKLSQQETISLRELCQAEDAYQAFMVDMTGGDYWDGNPLSGAVINAHPGYEPEGTWPEDE